MEAITAFVTEFLVSAAGTAPVAFFIAWLTAVAMKPDTPINHGMHAFFGMFVGVIAWFIMTVAIMWFF